MDFQSAMETFAEAWVAANAGQQNHYKHFLGGFAYHNLRQTNVFKYTVIDISKLLGDSPMLSKEDNLHPCAGTSYKHSSCLSLFIQHRGASHSDQEMLI
uniref:Uncharacterized protein n=1 Tax=Glossina palpalis gambiensis TaxID=67801 RepID=A0A1B0BPH6_9MUSC